MLPYILYELTLFSAGEDQDEGETDLGWALEFLTQRDQNYLKQHPETPSLYQCYRRGLVKYIRPAQALGECEEARVLREALGRRAKDTSVATTLQQVQRVFGGERFRDVGRVLQNRGGDCFPLVQKIIVRSKSTGCYELLAIGDLRLVYPYYEALSYNFSRCRYEFKDIVGFVDRGMQPVSRARLSNGTDLIATNDHKFWSVDGTGMNRRRIGNRTMGEYVEAYTEFKKGRMSKGCRGVRSRIVQAARIPSLDAVSVSPVQAYLAGIYAAEGEFSDGKHTRIAQFKTPIREKIEHALNAMSISFHYAAGRGRTPGSGAQYTLHGGAANPVIAMMRNQGTSSFDKRLPQGFLSADEASVAQMLEGHADGDAWQPRNGSYKRPNIDAVYATSSDELMEQLRLGTLILGRPTYAYRYEDHGGEGSAPIWRLHEYNTTATKLAARVEQVEEELGLPGLRFGTVRNAVPAGEARVGCIEVEGNHNFLLADGTLVSNCDNLGSWRAAELRQKGVRASPYITCRQEGGGLIYHVIVRWPDGSSEDPSLICGMGGADRKADRDEEIAKNAERCAMIERARARGWRPRIVRGDLDVVVEQTLAGMRAPSLQVRDRADVDRAIDAAVESLRRAA